MAAKRELTLLEKINTITWFDQIEKLRDILRRLLASVSGNIKFIQQGTNVTITGSGLTEEDPLIINSTGGGGVQSVTGDSVDNTDPLNPIINSTSQTLEQVLLTGNNVNADVNAVFSGGGGDAFYGSSGITLSQGASENETTTIQYTINGITYVNNIGAPLNTGIFSLNFEQATEEGTLYKTIIVPNADGTLATREWVEDLSPINGTFLTPTSITVVNGVITAIS